MDEDTVPALHVPQNITEFFPLPRIRSKQDRALKFIQEEIAHGVTDIIVSAPTGIGKSAIGIAAGYWAAQPDFVMDGTRGAYYLCTQKLLQDQLENDIGRYPLMMNTSASLKSATAYLCPKHGSCAAGMMKNPRCGEIRLKTCAYARAVKAFHRADVGITNYPYIFTASTYSEAFGKRRLLIADECHTLETQLLQFVEVVVGPKEIEKFAPTVGDVPEFKSMDNFWSWLESDYRPALEEALEKYDGDNVSPKRARERTELQAHLGRVAFVTDDFAENPDNWVFWMEKGKQDKFGDWTANAKPLAAMRYFDSLIRSLGTVRIYMSAYPGSKEVFCRTLGLKPSETAMISLGSLFPVEHRPIHVATIGSMGRKSQEETMPKLLRLLEKIMAVHAQEKGIIHCNSYAIGTAIRNHFAANKRVLFPAKASDRESVYKFHLASPDPTVIVSPSFTEGFDFVDSSARWQVIAKVPYPYLGDRQVAAKKDMDNEWYAMRTVMTVIQATGRICRSETDYGVTYITDSDFHFLYEKNKDMFPIWWRKAVIWRKP
jgi:Rad3-related DNA helicase